MIHFVVCLFIPQIIRDLISLMDVMDRWIDETPPVDQNSRFGNFAFRTWEAKLKENSVALVSSVLANKNEEAVVELAPYFEDSFGNATRIDYGTGHERLEPSSYVQKKTARTFANQYMFMACIHHINTVKVGPFAEHSNQLWNISGVPSWQKMNEGLLRMYIGEVLQKFPVVQHFVFGTLLSIEPETTAPSSTPEPLKGRLPANFTTVLQSSFFYSNNLYIFFSSSYFYFLDTLCMPKLQMACVLEYLQ
ncbi:PTPA domain containing protein [Trichuris trichiura]|uniref:Serine/threonine-protein phosphatase 2A activator n=1 Tax=Trichuris trichiura TaxID=36087 RepID=A0A077ZJP5_TRITR|nr:PTPA domain containing protein [Trichuris trichiura]